MSASHLTYHCFRWCNLRAEKKTRVFHLSQAKFCCFSRTITPTCSLSSMMLLLELRSICAKKALIRRKGKNWKPFSTSWKKFYFFYQNIWEENGNITPWEDSCPSFYIQVRSLDKLGFILLS